MAHERGYASEARQRLRMLTQAYFIQHPRPRFGFPVHRLSIRLTNFNFDS